ncbi:universal stress protein [Nocardioides gilvus]|uniref:universal stress protein n=1 Tax=Nocardioides gilvus TaxID=1735589 RepID=UPI000D74FC33|nr:universal stress protein [Nocardioides gilvus]
MTKKIVVGVDGSETAEAAALKAAALAEAMGAELVVVSAYAKLEVDTVRSGNEEFRFSTEEEALTTATQGAAIVREEFPGVTSRAESVQGKPAAALVTAAEEIGADLIVVGNKRVQGLGRMLGSIARDVAGHAPCDVYVAHTHER